VAKWMPTKEKGRFDSLKTQKLKASVSDPVTRLSEVKLVNIKIVMVVEVISSRT
jgi:hypothetical protein